MRISDWSSDVCSSDLLTNTLSVGTAATALVRHMLDGTPEIGARTGTVNPVVMECNDGAWLNDLRGLHVTEDEVLRSLAATGPARPAARRGGKECGRKCSCWRSQ